MKSCISNFLFSCFFFVFTPSTAMAIAKHTKQMYSKMQLHQEIHCFCCWLPIYASR
jgi:hypothetical protein